MIAPMTLVKIALGVIACAVLVSLASISWRKIKGLFIKKEVKP